MNQLSSNIYGTAIAQILHFIFMVGLLCAVYIGGVYHGRMIGVGEGWRDATESVNLPSASEIKNMAKACAR